MIATITRDELKRKMDRGDAFTLVETLPEGGFGEVHLPGAVDLPPKQLRKRAASILPDKDAEIIVYGASPTSDTSARVRRELDAMGYRNVKVYREGKTDWVRAGLPTEGKARLPK
ncbi:MAG TPA: rhodanese-like domain-containing protein [Gemmataceae bacterium]|nr:rhodanese-like domain-containing protein [Gemmataceae bacterium]